MRLYADQKSIGKKKAVIPIPIEYEKVPENLLELIEETVRIMVGAFKERQKKGPVPLEKERIEELAEIGRISFGIVYNDKEPDLQKAIDTAVLAYRDGLVRIFLNGELLDVQAADGVTPTEEEMAAYRLDLHEDDRLSFVRLAMLSGRIW